MTDERQTSSLLSISSRFLAGYENHLIAALVLSLPLTLLYLSQTHLATTAVISTQIEKKPIIMVEANRVMPVIVDSVTEPDSTVASITTGETFESQVELETSTITDLSSQASSEVGFIPLTSLEPDQNTSRVEEPEDRTVAWQTLVDGINGTSDSNLKLEQLLLLQADAPDIYEEPQIVALLQLIAYDADDRVRATAEQMQSDLMRLQSGEKSRIETLSAQLINIHLQGEPLSSFPNAEADHPDLAIADNRDETSMTNDHAQILDELNQLALLADDTKQRQAARSTLRGFDKTMAFDAASQQLELTLDPTERFTLIEELRSMIGEHDPQALLQTLERASLDNDPAIAEYAQQSVDLINSYVSSMEDRT